MDLSKAQLGDQFRIFVDDKGDILSSPSMKTVLATVIAIGKPRYTSQIILGWKPDDTRPTKCYDRAGNGSHEFDYLPSQKEYRFGYKVAKSLPVAIQIFNGLDGFPCKKCTNFFPLSAPNQKDGTLICWSCRNGK